MTIVRAVLVLLVAVAFGASLVFPAGDLPETPYDESEPLHFECTQVFRSPLFVVMSQVSVSAAVSASCAWAASGGEIRSSESVPSPTILDHVFRC